MKLPTITLSSEVLSRFSEAVQKEWIITNGLGGFSSSTVLGLNTRKYHGLLVAALNPPGERTVCLSKLDEDVLIGENIYRLGANEFHGTIYPQGYQYLKEFSISPFPTFTYQIPNLTIKKTLFMPQQKNLVISLYTVSNENMSNAKIRIYPMMTCRHFHTVVDPWKNPLSFRQEIGENRVKLIFTAPDATVIGYSSAGNFVEKPNWVNAVHYHEENVRGELDTDDIYQPGYYEIPIFPNNETRFAIAVGANKDIHQTEDLIISVGRTVTDFDNLFMQVLDERSRFLDSFYNYSPSVIPNAWLNWLLLASDSFVTKEANYRRSIIAGYFWFSPWGRDTFISLPGLLMATGRFNEAKYVLQSFGRYYKNGLIPNLIDDTSGEPVYNTVDGTFLYVNAVLQYLKYTGDFQFIQDHLWEMLKSIIDHHVRGTEFNIRLDSDGLISHGSRLTWMDANIEGQAVTPRTGKAVEVQALWYNTLKIMALLANRFHEQAIAEKFVTMAKQTNASFNDKFWNPKKNSLFDVLETYGPDLSLRPNQIIATSLDFSMLDIDRSRLVVDLVRQEFLTPCGLRTLARSDPQYKSIYNGIMRVRDQAYHNGAVWPWLLGPFISGYLKAWGTSAQNLEFAMKTFLQTLFERQIYEGGLGTISEIFDGDPPHRPRGCIAQAWSVAELLRAYIEDILQIRPKYEQEVFKYGL